MYLSGLQFMALASGPAALMAVPLIGKGEIGCMEQELAGPYAVPISILMRHIIAALPLEPYRLILQQVGSILPVSYTHLDVYKRQRIHRGGIWSHRYNGR